MYRPGKQGDRAQSTRVAPARVLIAAHLSKCLLLIGEAADILMVELRRTLAHRVVGEVLALRLKLLEEAKAPVALRLQSAQSNSSAGGQHVDPRVRTIPSHSASPICAGE